MKISFNFDAETRSFQLTPENELEHKVLEEMEKRASKGQAIKLSKVLHPIADNAAKTGFQVVIQVNGGNGKS